MEYELYLILQRVDGINHVVILLKVEILLSLSRISLVQGSDFSLRIYLEQSLAHHVDLWLANGC